MPLVDLQERFLTAVFHATDGSPYRQASGRGIGADVGLDEPDTEALVHELLVQGLVRRTGTPLSLQLTDAGLRAARAARTRRTEED
jgi:hypothetical protein